jgi:hypothetical protein
MVTVRVPIRATLIEPPIWRIMFSKPAAWVKSRPCKPPKARLLMGTKINPRPSPLTISGQKKYDSLVVEVSINDIQVTNMPVTTKPNTIRNLGLAPFCKSLPIKGMLRPDSNAPGINIAPVSVAVKPKQGQYKYRAKQNEAQYKLQNNAYGYVAFFHYR